VTSVHSGSAVKVKYVSVGYGCVRWGNDIIFIVGDDRWMILRLERKSPILSSDLSVS